MSKPFVGSLLDFAENDLPALAPDLPAFHLRRLRGAARWLWTSISRPPTLKDLNAHNFRRLAKHMLAAQKPRAVETVNDVLKFNFEIGVIAARHGFLPDEPPYLQLQRDGQVRHCDRPIRRPGHVGGAWNLPDLLRLFEVAGSQKGNIGGIPEGQWWTSLLLTIITTRLHLHQLLDLRWDSLDLKVRQLHFDGKTIILDQEIVPKLIALKKHGKPSVFPAPSSAPTMIHTIYRRMETMLVDGGLRRRVFRPFDRLRKVELGGGQLEKLAGQVVILPPGTCPSVPPSASGPQRKGRRRFYSAGLDEQDTRRDAALTDQMPLSAFYAEWMEPVVLEDRKEARANTKTAYREALVLWQGTTSDPPIREIKDLTWLKFLRGLRDYRFTRGERGDERALSEASQAKTQSIIRSVLKRAFYKGLLPAMPEILIRRAHTEVKGIFTVDEARQLAAYLRGAPHSRRDARGSYAARWYWSRGNLEAGWPWWLAFIAASFYTGLRRGELFALKWRMLVKRQGGHWLQVPMEAVSKTRKPVSKPVHHCLLEALQQIGPGEPDEPIFPWSHSLSCFTDNHKRMLLAAGLTNRAVHAWRRTYASEIAMTGLPDAQQTAQKSLSHASVDTTIGSYLGESVGDAFTRRLPRLW